MGAGSDATLSSDGEEMFCGQGAFTLQVASELSVACCLDVFPWAAAGFSPVCLFMVSQTICSAPDSV